MNTAVSALRTMVRLLVGFALLPLLLDGIGSSRTGLFLFATTLTGYFIAVDNGVGASVTRYVAEHRTRRDAASVAGTVRGSLVVMAAVGLLAAGVLAVVAITASSWLFTEPGLRTVAEPTILIAAATMVLYWPSRVGVAALNGLERYDQSAWIQIVTGVLVLISIGALAHEHASVVLLTGVLGLIASLEGVIAGALAWRRLGVDRSWSRGRWFRGEQMRSVLGFSFAAFAIGIGTTLLNGFDRTIVGAVVGASAIVGYDVAQRPTSAVQTIAGLSGLALISPVARLHTLGSHERIRRLVLIASLVSIAVAAPIAVLTMVLAHPFVVAWLGARYGRYAGLIQVFVSYWVVGCATTALSSAMYGIGRLKTYARIMIVVSVVSLPLSLGLALAWGTIGVILGTVIPSALAMPVFVASSLALLEIPVRRFVREVIVPGFGPLTLWTLLVVALKVVFDPSGYAGLVTFCALTLPLSWAAHGALVRRRLRAIRGDAEAPDRVLGTQSVAHVQAAEPVI